ncbi:MAG: hypothetical protein M3N07_05135, partial [Pseudomonadota bacterium]|nr:hypothetical protein [Pseudomonadota bacterium]
GGPGTELIEEPEPEPEAEPQPLARTPVDEHSIADLMARLERGLAKRLRQRGVFPDPDPATPPVFAGEGDERLRSAIENLQKMASRAG